MGATFSNVSLKEMAQRKSISCQETILFILVRRLRSWKFPEADTEREEGLGQAQVWAGCWGRAQGEGMRKPLPLEAPG